MSTIELRGVAKRFASPPVLASVDLTVADGSITAVLGASGSGKTTLLRIIAGFERVDGGTVSIGGRVVDDRDVFVRAEHRGVGYVPQEGALFPHLTVAGNVNFGVPRAARAGTDELLELVGLADLRRRYPHQLSGGQQQRVAVARALAVRPGVVLLDEPFGSLDASLRTEVRRDVARLLAETGATTVLVTHDQDEALALADQVAVLRHGVVATSGAPHALYRQPPDLTAATSLGDANILDADAHGSRARCVLGDVPVEPDGTGAVHGPVRLLLRPEQLVLHLHETPHAVGATVVDAQFHGHDTLVSVRVDEPHHVELVARTGGDVVLARGQPVWVEARGRARAWSVDPLEVTSHEARGRRGDGAGPDAPAGPGERRVPTTRRHRRPRRRGLVVSALGALLVVIGVAVNLLVSGGPSPDAVGQVVFHADIETTGRVHLSDTFAYAKTSKKVRSCAQAGATGNEPSTGPHTWLVPAAPADNTAVILIGTKQGAYRGPGQYSQHVLSQGGGVLGIGTEVYALTSVDATAAMTVNADGSGNVTFANVPGDDDTPHRGWHGGISGSISWTCTS